MGRLQNRCVEKEVIGSDVYWEIVYRRHLGCDIFTILYEVCNLLYLTSAYCAILRREDGYLKVWGSELWREIPNVWLVLKRSVAYEAW